MWIPPLVPLLLSLVATQSPGGRPRTHAVFDQKTTRQLMHRWRPLDTEEGMARLVPYLRAAIEVEQTPSYGVATFLAAKTPSADRMALYVFGKKGELRAVLWPTTVDALDKIIALRHLDRWHRARFFCPVDDLHVRETEEGESRDAPRTAATTESGEGEGEQGENENGGGADE